MNRKFECVAGLPRFTRGKIYTEVGEYANPNPFNAYLKPDGSDEVETTAITFKGVVMFKQVNGDK